eukprot:c25888_g1_i2 orf=781-1599(+)
MRERRHSFQMNRSNNSGTADEVSEVIDWELRPGGMLVQRRSSTSIPAASSGPLIKVKVSHGLYQHETTIPAQATFGDLKWILVHETGLQPNEQRLLFRGKEQEDNDYLHIAGVQDQSKIILVEDPASKERKLEEIGRNDGIARACQAVAKVRVEVDKLAGQVAALEGVVNSRNKASDGDFTVLTELLMRQLLKLDGIDAEGEAKVQRRIEVRRVQNFVEVVDALKVRNSSPICSNSVVVTTQWETFDSGVGSLMAPPPLASSSMATNWELFD